MIEIKRWDNGKVIHSGDFKSVKECLEDGLNRGINFYRAYLNGASLNGASLKYASLDDASLNDASLNRASLNGASLDDASLNRASLNGTSLNGASLKYASLNGASLNGASFWNCVGNKKELKSLQLETYSICYSSTNLQIGCENHPIEDWFNFDNRRILEMEGKEALKWWKKWKDYIKMTLEMSPATPYNTDK